MAGVAWYAVKTALVTQLRTVLAPVVVYDGPTLTGDAPLSYLSVGASPSTDAGNAGGFRQDPSDNSGYTVAESGDILCELGAVTGNTVMPPVFGLFALLAAHVQADQTLGGTLYPGSTVTVSAGVVAEQTRSGAVQRLIVTISYFTRL